MVSMALPETASGKVVVEIGDDGTMTVEINPGAPGADTHHLIVKAAERLAGIAAQSVADHEPVHCPACGVELHGIIAPPAGVAHAVPCGHTLTAA
jgi:hypothetical protein